MAAAQTEQAVLLVDVAQGLQVELADVLLLLVAPAWKQGPAR